LRLILPLLPDSISGAFSDIIYQVQQAFGAAQDIIQAAPLLLVDFPGTSSSISSVKPIIIFNGVRKSWDIFSGKADPTFMSTFTPSAFLRAISIIIAYKQPSDNIL